MTFIIFITKYIDRVNENIDKTGESIIQKRKRKKLALYLLYILTTVWVNKNPVEQKEEEKEGGERSKWLISFNKSNLQY